MKKIILLQIIFCLILQKCFSQVPFEGIVTYKVETVLKQENHPYNEYYSQKYGDTLKIYIAGNGNHKRKYFNTGNLGLDWMIYDQNKNEQYAKWHSMDSIFYYECSALVTKLEEIKDGDEKIVMGKKCNSIITKAFEPEGKETIINKFYFSGDEFVAPNTFKKYKDGYLDKVYEKSKSHFLRWEMELKYVYVIFEAIEISEEKVNPELFRIPKGLELVKM